MLCAVLNDTRPARLPCIRLFQHRLNIGALLAQILRDELVSVAAINVCHCSHRRLDGNFTVVLLLGPFPERQFSQRCA